MEAAFPLTYAFAARRGGSGQLMLSASMNQSAVLQVSREPTLGPSRFLAFEAQLMVPSYVHASDTPAERHQPDATGHHR
jgi:hypothetical protein